MQTSDHVVARSSGAIVRAVPVAPSQLRVAARSAGWGRISAGMAWLTACARLAGAGTGVDVAHAPARRFSAARRLGALPALCLLGMLALLMEIGRASCREIVGEREAARAAEKMKSTRTER